MKCIKRGSALMAAALAVAIHTGCNDAPTLPRVPGTFTFSPSQLYAGGEVKIIGADAHRLTDYWLASTEPERGSADSVVLEVVGTRFDTIIARVPAEAGGDYVLRVRGYPAPIGQVMVAGFRAAVPHPLLGCNIEVAPGAIAAVIAGRNGTSLVRFRPATGSIEELIPAAELGVPQFMLGLSYRREKFFVQPRTVNVEGWDLDGAPRRLEVLVGPQPAVYQISDSVFFTTRGSVSGSRKMRNGSYVAVETFTGARYSDVQGAAIHPSGELGLVMFNQAFVGQPVVDGRTGLIRYHIPLLGAYYAQFSASLDTLFVAGHDKEYQPDITGYTNYLLAVDPQTGAEFGRWEAGAGEFVGLGHDADNGLLFVAMLEGRNLDLHVLEARGFARRGRMRAVARDSDFCLSKLVFDNSGTFIVSPNYTMSFDYLP